jgi:DNA mismatch repair protein MutS
MDRKRAETAGSTAQKSSQVRAQYDALKRQHPGRILLFQLGDFYETFEGDARTLARVCGITLTSRELSKGDRVALAGVPIHRAAPHIGKLIAAGYHVAICDQVSEPGKGLVEREVTRVVTPGTVAEPGLISPHENNLIVALAWGRSGVGLAAADVTTGELMTTVVDVYVLDADEQPGAALLAAELQRLAPAECLIAESALFPTALPGHTTTLPPSRFDLGVASDAVRRLFGVSSLDGFGLAADSPALAALGALIGFVGEANYRLLASLREPRPYVVGSHLALDPTTRRNLELTRTSRHGQVRGSLFHAVDRTRTPMGARRLRRLLGQPLVSEAVLETRLDAIETLVEDGTGRGRARSILGRLGDVERLFGRVRQASATPREVVTLAQALRLLPDLQAELAEAGGLLQEHGAAIDGCPDLVAAIERTLDEPGSPRLIRPGHSAELDDLVNGMGESRRWLAQLERRERERTGIRSLKVGYNKVFGYYLEVTRPNLRNVPPEYQRRQSLVSAERFVTPELKEREALILTAEARIDELEGELFQALLRKIGEQARPILRTVEAVADLDVLAGLADVAADRGWCRPSFAEDDELTIVGGRHPVLEAMLPGGEIVPNACRLGGIPDDERGRLLIVTGPNMGGKSTYLRMVALCVLLAQVGSFVPAESARIGLVDRLFTRVGSEDDLAAGASTFLVEMAEIASILRQSTFRSLVVLDEVGRGTSTHDGLCIAQAVLEHLHDAIGARTLFATHFHELTALADSLSTVRNVTVAVDEKDGQLSFLYRVVPGAADRSYGVQVARLAGLLGDVTDRAAALLWERERGGDGWLRDAGPVVLSGMDAPLTPRPPLPHAGEGEEAGAIFAADNLAIREGSPPRYLHTEPTQNLPAETVREPGEANADGVVTRPTPAVSPSPAHGSVGIKGPHGRPDEGRGVGASPATPMADDNRADLLPLSGAERGRGDKGPHGRSDLGGEVSTQVAARLLAEILALDLGSLTPIQALTLLHDLQTAAREAVPWNDWMANLSGVSNQTERS